MDAERFANRWSRDRPQGLWELGLADKGGGFRIHYPACLCIEAREWSDGAIQHSISSMGHRGGVQKMFANLKVSWPVKTARLYAYSQ